MNFHIYIYFFFFFTNIDLRLTLTNRVSASFYEKNRNPRIVLQDSMHVGTARHSYHVFFFFFLGTTETVVSFKKIKLFLPPETKLNYNFR